MIRVYLHLLIVTLLALPSNSMAESFWLVRMHATGGSKAPDRIAIIAGTSVMKNYRTDTGLGGLNSPLKRQQISSELMLIPMGTLAYSPVHVSIPPERWYLRRQFYILSHLSAIKVAQNTNYYLGDFLNSPDQIIHQYTAQTIKQACVEFYDELHGKPLILPYAPDGVLVIEAPCEEATLSELEQKLSQ